MTGRMIGFISWCIGGGLLIAIGIAAYFSKKAVGFWANADMFEVTDVKKYNHAVAKLFCVFGLGFALLGLPMLNEQNSLGIFLSIIGTLFESLVVMAVYVIVIEKKYRKKL
ncbi:MAG: hypothetical protein EOM34_07575 [Clostridia bacterium]|nr:hypothetical protein [Lachnospiraceae bacterium]NCC00529.1 hypothetical protein [Clostridia bacterium]NCD02538.1 hypothetical protein [Clostridia bacterium]